MADVHTRQFVCMRESVGGRYNPQNVYNMTPTQEHYDIVDWAMAGGRLLGIDDSLFFLIPTAIPVRPSSRPMWASYIIESVITVFTLQPAAIRTPDALFSGLRKPVFFILLQLFLPEAGSIRRYRLWHLAAIISLHQR